MTIIPAMDQFYAADVDKRNYFEMWVYAHPVIINMNRTLSKTTDRWHFEHDKLKAFELILKDRGIEFKLITR